MVAMTELAGDALAPAALHAAFELAFSDYLVGPFALALEQWPRFLARQGVDLGLSRALVRGGAIQAFALVAPRITRWRLAGMGAVPTARGSGAAPRLLDDFMTRARLAGMAAVELEVFAQNERARKLYEGRGFESLHELHAWQAPAPDGEPRPVPDSVALIGREQAFAWIAREALPRLPDLPMQVTPAALAASAAQLQAWQAGSAVLVFAETAPDLLTISSLIDWQAAQGDALMLLRALRSAHPGHRIVVPACSARTSGVRPCVTPDSSGSRCTSC